MSNFITDKTGPNNSFSAVGRLWFSHSITVGGKSPVAVFEDADQENALNGITAGIFGASGQSCIAGSRLYLQKNIYNQF